jgi:TolB protein
MKPRRRIPTKIVRFILILSIGLSLVALGWIGVPRLYPNGIHFPSMRLPELKLNQAQGDGTPVPATATPTLPLEISSQPTAPSNPVAPIILQNSGSPEENLRAQGVLVLAMRDGLFIHLFAYHPIYLPLTRLTNNPWDDITPSLSPDGTRLAYASRQNGYWDLYILDLSTGQTSRVTDTPEYEASPTWSPDGQWIAYERYNGVSLDIYLQSLTEPSAQPIQLTNGPELDRSPAWSPQGREIAFLSNRSGDEDIWLARLDNVDERFINISHNPLAQDHNPVWSADGSRLAWATEQGGDRQIVVWNKNTPDIPALISGDGDRAAWSPDGSTLFSEVRDPAGSGLAAYNAATGRLSMPYTPLPGALYGFTWVKGPLPTWLNEVLQNPDFSPVPTLWQPIITRKIAPAGRVGLVKLSDVTAPQPMLHDAVDEAFTALRQQVANEAGWDALSSLENAYVPVTSPSTPTIQDDWLYTGRAFAINPLILSAGWMAITREDFSGQTYWRVFLKARYQDGSMGMPLAEQTWDMNARFAGDTRAYEQGGKLGPALTGYWVDLTELANRYSWKRLPSWINWRTFYPSIRFNQFVITNGLEWHQAMAELYPPEAMATSTPLLTYTPTETITPAYRRPGTETPTPTITPIPTRRPTWTPLAP